MGSERGKEGFLVRRGGCCVSSWVEGEGDRPVDGRSSLGSDTHTPSETTLDGSTPEYCPETQKP